MLRVSTDSGLQGHNSNVSVLTKGGFRGGGGNRGSVPPSFPKWSPPPPFEEIIPMKLNFIIRLS